MPVQWCLDLVGAALDRVVAQINSGDFADFNEATVQHHLALQLHLNALFGHQQELDVELEKKVTRADGRLFPKKNRSTANIDIFFVDEGQTRCAIELKFFQRANQREPNNRCDVYLDLANLETYLEEHADVGVFILVTNHAHYYDPNARFLGAAAADFNTRDGHNYERGTALTYGGTGPYQGTSVNLEGSYHFTWQYEQNETAILVLVVRPVAAHDNP